MIRMLTLAAASLAVVATFAPPSGAVAAATAAGASVDCSTVYGPGKSAACKVVPCDPPYDEFIGVWSGPFEEYVQKLSTPDKPVFRPYQDRIVYDRQDCLTNIANGERFVVGHRTDTYPAFGALAAQTKTGLLITGRRADGTPFLRTVDDQGVYDYVEDSRDAATETVVWRLEVPAQQMTFRVTDGRDMSARPANVRNVTIEMTVGPAAHPYWRGVIARGHHAKQ